MKDDGMLARASLQHGLYEQDSSEYALMSTVDTGCIHVWHIHRDPNAIRLLEQQLDNFDIKPCHVRKYMNAVFKQSKQS